ncbi:MAG: DUF721 domain-containing protein [Nitrospirae bacterium]|nr:DUF721 domain-containing protein [Nitrospirota bacterium]
MRAGSFFASVSSILSGIAHRYGMETKLLEHQLRRRWPEIAGEPIAAHTRPDQIRFKKLYLIVDNSVWLQQLTFLKPTLLETINAAAGSQIVSDIVLRVGEVTGEAPEGKRQNANGKNEETEPLPEAVAQAAVHAAAVADPELRSRLTEVMATALTSRTDSSNRANRGQPSKK